MTCIRRIAGVVLVAGSLTSMAAAGDHNAGDPDRAERRLSPEVMTAQRQFLREQSGSQFVGAEGPEGLVVTDAFLTSDARSLAPDHCGSASLRLHLQLGDSSTAQVLVSGVIYALREVDVSEDGPGWQLHLPEEPMAIADFCAHHALEFSGETDRDVANTPEIILERVFELAAERMP